MVKFFQLKGKEEKRSHVNAKRTKHRKMFRGRMKGTAQRGNTVAFGDYGLQALEPHWITNRQIESCRVAINRTFKREGKTS